MADPITIGALAIGGLGSLAQMFKDSPEYSLPSLEALSRSNPELYDQLMQIKYMSEQASNQADRSGITAAEKIQMQDAQSNLRSQQGNRGLAGSSVASAQQADMANRMMAQQQERALREEMARRGQAAQLAGQFTNQYMGIAQPQAQSMYNQDLAEQQARGQFFSGLLNSGLNMYGTDQYLRNIKSTLPTGDY